MSDKKYDVFISYRREGGLGIARLLFNLLEQMGLSVFFDNESLRTGKFDEAILRSIESSENFVSILSKGALDRCVNEDDWVRQEIESAMKCGKNIVPVMMPEFEHDGYPSELPLSMSEFKSYNAVHYIDHYFEATIQELCIRLKGININEGKKDDAIRTFIEENYDNINYDPEDEKEQRRLIKQRNLSKKLEQSTWDKIMQMEGKFRILDVGCHNGDLIMERIGKSERVEKLVGLEWKEKLVEAANDNYRIENKIEFFCQDITAPDFEGRLTDISKKMDIEKFNVIHVSMVLLHIADPLHLLNVLKKFLAKDGRILIKDIDDGFNVAYPDPGGRFAKATAICADSEFSGLRENGRRVHQLLSNVGFTDLCLENCGIRTTGMDVEEREDLFDCYFGFIIDDMRLMSEKYPDKTKYKENFEWFSREYDDMRHEFIRSDFFFFWGMVMFSATV